MKNDCKKIQKLLPSYCNDNNCLSKEDLNLVKNHLTYCDKCKIKESFYNDFTQTSKDNHFNFRKIKLKFYMTIIAILIVTLSLICMFNNIIIPSIVKNVFLEKRITCEKAITSLVFFTNPLSDSIQTTAEFSNTNITIRYNYLLNTNTPSNTYISGKYISNHFLDKSKIIESYRPNMNYYIKQNKEHKDFSSRSFLKSEKENLNIPLNKIKSQVSLIFKQPLTSSKLKKYLNNFDQIDHAKSWFVIYTDDVTFNLTDIWGFSTTVPRYRAMNEIDKNSIKNEMSISWYTQPANNFTEAENIFKIELTNLKKTIPSIKTFNGVKNSYLLSDIDKLITLLENKPIRYNGCIISAPTKTLYENINLDNVAYMKVLSTNFK